MFRCTELLTGRSGSSACLQCMSRYVSTAIVTLVASEKRVEISLCHPVVPCLGRTADSKNVGRIYVGTMPRLHLIWFHLPCLNMIMATLLGKWLLNTVASLNYSLTAMYRGRLNFNVYSFCCLLKKFILVFHLPIHKMHKCICYISIFNSRFQ